MSQALATRAGNHNLSTAPVRNAFEQYAEEANRNRIVGELIKFNRGEWTYGRNADEMKAGSRFVANMDGLTVGWTKWKDNKPTEVVAGLVLEAFQPPRRSELGDEDEKLWEIDTEGRPKDPWQFGNTLILKDENGDQLYTFSASSKGSIAMIGKLCGDYGRQMRQRPTDFPIVEIGRSHYMHPVYKKTYVPEMKIVGWAAKADVLAALAGEAAEAAQQAEDDAADEPVRASPKAKTAKQAEATTRF